MEDFEEVELEEDVSDYTDSDDDCMVVDEVVSTKVVQPVTVGFGFKAEPKEVNGREAIEKEIEKEIEMDLQQMSDQEQAKMKGALERSVGLNLLNMTQSTSLEEHVLNHVASNEVKDLERKHQ